MIEWMNETHANFSLNWSKFAKKEMFLECKLHYYTGFFLLFEILHILQNNLTLKIKFPFYSINLFVFLYQSGCPSLWSPCPPPFPSSDMLFLPKRYKFPQTGRGITATNNSGSRSDLPYSLYRTEQHCRTLTPTLLQDRTTRHCLFPPSQRAFFQAEKSYPSSFIQNGGCLGSFTIGNPSLAENDDSQVIPPPTQDHSFRLVLGNREVDLWAPRGERGISGKIAQYIEVNKAVYGTYKYTYIHI